MFGCLCYIQRVHLDVSNRFSWNVSKCRWYSIPSGCTDGTVRYFAKGKMVQSKAINHYHTDTNFSGKALMVQSYTVPDK